VSIQRRSTGYLVRWRRDGRQYGRMFDRKKDAEAFELEQKRAAQLGAFAPAAPSKRTVDDYLDEWWERESVRWAASTRAQRKDVLNRWVRKQLGGVRLADLGGRRVGQWRSEIVAKGCPAPQANQALSVLSAALGCAVRDGLLPANPCHGLGKLPHRVARPRALAPDEVERILAKLPTLRDVAAVSLMAYAGLRCEEMIALTWDSVRDHVVIVDDAFTAGELKDLKAGSRRTVELVEPLRDDLERLRPARPEPGAVVCAGATGGYLDLHNWRRRVWHEARMAAKVAAATPYDCRHTYASLLIHEGRSLPYVTAAMGHASATTTLTRYVHLLDEQRLGTAVPMVDAISAARAVHRVCTPSVVRRLRQAAPGS
jgi:integrase